MLTNFLRFFLTGPLVAWVGGALRCQQKNFAVSRFASSHLVSHLQSVNYYFLKYSKQPLLRHTLVSHLQSVSPTEGHSLIVRALLRDSLTFYSSPSSRGPRRGQSEVLQLIWSRYNEETLSRKTKLEVY